MFGAKYISTTAILALDNNKLPGNGTRYYQVISILSDTKIDSKVPFIFGRLITH